MHAFIHPDFQETSWSEPVEVVALKQRVKVRKAFQISKIFMTVTGYSSSSYTQYIFVCVQTSYELSLDSQE